MDFDTPHQPDWDDSKPVTHWIALLRAGDEQAAQHLWEEYFIRLVRLAQNRVRATRVDDEAVAASAFNSFCLAAMNGRFPLVADRHDLWQLLIFITGQKAVNHLRREQALKRGGGATFEAETVLDDQAGSEPTPEFAAMVLEEFDLLLDKLPNDDLRKIALWKMEGYTHEEIAQKLDCAVRTVANKLDLIRKILRGSVQP